MLSTVSPLLSYAAALLQRQQTRRTSSSRLSSAQRRQQRMAALRANAAAAEAGHGGEGFVDGNTPNAGASPLQGATSCSSDDDESDAWLADLAPTPGVDIEGGVGVAGDHVTHTDSDDDDDDDSNHDSNGNGNGNGNGAGGTNEHGAGSADGESGDVPFPPQPADQDQQPHTPAYLADLTRAERTQLATAARMLAPLCVALGDRTRVHGSSDAAGCADGSVRLRVRCILQVGSHGACAQRPCSTLGTSSN